MSELGLPAHRCMQWVGELGGSMCIPRGGGSDTKGGCNRGSASSFRTDERTQVAVRAEEGAPIPGAGPSCPCQHAAFSLRPPTGRPSRPARPSERRTGRALSLRNSGRH